MTERSAFEALLAKVGPSPPLPPAVQQLCADPASGARILHAPLTDPVVLEWHRRVAPFVLFFIDAGSNIDAECAPPARCARLHARADAAAAQARPAVGAAGGCAACGGGRRRGCCRLRHAHPPVRMAGRVPLPAQPGAGIPAAAAPGRGGGAAGGGAVSRRRRGRPRLLRGGPHRRAAAPARGGGRARRAPAARRGRSSGGGGARCSSGSGRARVRSRARAAAGGGADAA